MDGKFRDRKEAGELLARELSRYSRAKRALVLALPRGGVPVAYEVATCLALPLDVFGVRKLGVPGHEELAMGAVATGGVRVLNEDVVSRLDISGEDIEAVAKREQRELERRESAYRAGQPMFRPENRTVILVDDGVATGSTMRAAIQALRKQGVEKIVVAVPTMAASSVPDFNKLADEVVAVMAPENFMAVGQWYEDFSQTDDEEVRDCLEKARHLRAA